MKPLDRLLRMDGVKTLGDLDSAVSFATSQASGARVLLLPGDVARPEVTDVAVVITELRAEFPELEIGVAAVSTNASDEPALRERLPVTTFPALLFVKDGVIVKTLSRMQSWSTYATAARSVLS